MLWHKPDFAGLIATAEQDAVGRVELLEDRAAEGHGLAACRIQEGALEGACGLREAELELLARRYDLVSRTKGDLVGDHRSEPSPGEHQTVAGGVEHAVAGGVSGTEDVALPGEAVDVILYLPARCLTQTYCR